MKVVFIEFYDERIIKEFKMSSEIRVPNMGEEVWFNGIHYTVRRILTDLTNKTIQVYLLSR